MRTRLELLTSFVKSLPARTRGALSVLALDPETPMNLVTALDRWAGEAPDRTFLIFEGERISYAAMHARVVRRAATLAAAGVRAGDAVALVMSNHPAFLVNAWAIARLGAVASLVNTHVTGAALRHAVLSVEPRAVVAGRDHLPAVREAVGDAPGLVWGWEETRAQQGDEPTEGALDLAAADASPSPAPPSHPTRGDALYAYIFTSGTTGLPKAGRITHSRAFTAAQGFGRFTMGLGPADVTYVCLPLFHSSGFLIGAGSAVLTGSTLALGRKLSVSRFWDEVCEADATTFVYIGEVCRYLVQAPPHPRERSHRLRGIVGNGMRPDVWKKFVERFAPGIVHEFYGATEGNVNMTNLFGVEGSVGRMPPIPWLDNAFLARFDRQTDTVVRDARGLCIACKAGEEGELLGRIDPKRATTRFEGYLGKEATESKILRDVQEKGDAYFRSGDLLRRDWMGFYYFVDRVGDTYRWKGENVSTNEVGDVCGSFDGVELANVYGVAVPGADGRAGMVALLLAPGAHFSPDRFYEHALGALPPYAAPLFVRLLEGAQVTATFKLKKADLVTDGFDPRRVGDLLFVRDDRARTYAPVDEAAFDAIQSGAVRL